MTISQLENAFQKTIHPDLKNKLFISVEDYQIDTDEGIIVFLDENFDEIYKFDPRMIFHLKWYLENPSKHYNTALNSSNPLDNVLAIIDKQTGSRCIDDWKNECCLCRSRRRFHLCQSTDCNPDNGLEKENRGSLFVCF